MQHVINQVLRRLDIDEKSIEIKYAADKDHLKVDVTSYGGLVPFNLKGGIQELNDNGVATYKCFLGTCGDCTIDGDFENVDDYSLYMKE